MFKSVEDVDNASIGDLMKLVGNASGAADYSDILGAEYYVKYVEALKIVKQTERLAEKIAFRIRDKIEEQGVEDELKEEDGYYEGSDLLTEFMQAIAQESGKIYTDYDYETHPDSFWIPSTC